MVSTDKRRRQCQWVDDAFGGRGWVRGGAILSPLLLTVTDGTRPADHERYQGAYAHAVLPTLGKAYPQTDWDNVALFRKQALSPYSTDMSKGRPLTFKHIQDGEALPDSVPRNPHLIEAQQGVVQGNAEIHNVGEVWWRAVGAVILAQHARVWRGAAAHEELSGHGAQAHARQLTFTEARDAIARGAWR